MTIRFNDSEAPSGLEDELPAGCALHKVIDAVCTEPGCPNGAKEQDTPDGMTRPIWCSPEAETSPSIFRTRTKTRCIL